MNPVQKRISLFLAAMLCLVLSTYVSCAAAAVKAQAKPKLPKNLSGLSSQFDLAKERQSVVSYYIQETQVIQLGFDGRRKGVETYTVKLRVVPAKLAGKEGDEYTVREFSIKFGDKEPVTIPELAGWSYVFKQREGDLDEKGQIFGIAHDRFENLTTSQGAKLSGIASYPVYNSFVDFHGFCDVFARPVKGGAGVQDLKKIGLTIRHAAAFTEPPVNLGKGIKEGSIYRNGDVRIVLKGVSVVDGAACVLIGFDSGESTLKMIIPAGPNQDIITEGGSEYIGDIYIDLATLWVRKVTLDEFVVTETRLPEAMAGGALGQKVYGYTIRHLLIRMVSKAEYEE
jgi:hypothetical protein